MTTFKVGDVLEATTADVSSTYRRITLKRLNEDGRFSSGDMWWTPDYLEKNFHVVNSEPQGPIAFILQYELDHDPFETFATMKEVEARIKELAKRADLKRESIKVYEVAKTYHVSLDTRVFFNALATETGEIEVAAPKRKRGRPVGSKTSKFAKISRAQKARWAKWREERASQGF